MEVIPITKITLPVTPPTVDTLLALLNDVVVVVSEDEESGDKKSGTGGGVLVKFFLYRICIDMILYVSRETYRVATKTLSLTDMEPHQTQCRTISFF